MNTDRRKFFTSIALGVGATAFPNFIKDMDDMQPVNLNTNIDPKNFQIGSKKLKVNIESFMMEVNLIIHFQSFGIGLS